MTKQNIHEGEKKQKGFPAGNETPVVIENLTKAYGEHVVFRDLSLTFPAGRTTCLMAPSGAGKTTLLRILMGLETPDRGTVTGLETKRISAVFQEPRLCENLSAFANIRMVRKKKLWEKDKGSWEEISRGMQELGLGGCERQPVREMSGGMRQRVALLRALYARWEILFLDEPFQGLDQESRERTMAYTRKLCEGKTVILVTHSMEEAEQMGQIVRLPVCLM